MSKISFVVAIDNNGAIGKDGDMAWSLPADQALFKKITMGHPMIMGRTTYESIGRALPGRTTIIVTHNKNYRAEGCLVVGSIDAAIEAAKQAPGGKQEIFVIGGQAIFELAMPLADRLYLSKVDTAVKGDKFFKYNQAKWQQTFSEKHTKDSENPYNWEYTILERKH